MEKSNYFIVGIFYEAENFLLHFLDMLGQIVRLSTQNCKHFDFTKSELKSEFLPR